MRTCISYENVTTSPMAGREGVSTWRGGTVNIVPPGLKVEDKNGYKKTRKR